MSDSSNICLSCGLCCDGTLIGFVQLDREELPVIREVMDIEETNGNGFFLQPCSKYCDGCTIYSERPRHCGLFKCGLLTSVEQKELSFDAAVELIEEVQQKKVAIEEKLAILELELQSRSFYFKMVELNKYLHKKEADGLLGQDLRGLMTELNELDHLLVEKFGLSIL